MGYAQQELTVLKTFLSVFYAHQWYDITNDVTHAPLTHED